LTRSELPLTYSFHFAGAKTRTEAGNACLYVKVLYDDEPVFFRGLPTKQLMIGGTALNLVINAEEAKAACRLFRRRHAPPVEHGITPRSGSGASGSGSAAST
jgi:hypothetical protein